MDERRSYGRLYFYDRDHIVEERDLDLNITSRYLHGSGVDDPLLLINKEGVFAYTKDGLGSIRELTPINTSSQVPYQRYRYSSYGVTSQMLEGVTQGRKLIENRYAYTGREIEDEVGLYYYRARYYDPELGRFISEDPIGFNGGDVNFYGYVGGDPMSYTDPTGLKLQFGSSEARNQLSPSLAQIWSTDAGRILINQLSGSSETYTINFNNQGKNYQLGNQVTVDPSSSPLINVSPLGVMPASTTRILAHELGHLTGTKDFGNMNINAWENPIMGPLEGYLRTSYGMRGIRCGR